MSFRINTNIAALQAQDYLRQTSDLQQKTIGRVTSGLRILSSGDDAAGLAIANTLRSDQAVLDQGIRNANDGLSTLQTIDGGINNISKLLDRARTLATQSASGTFSGSRQLLNSEFGSVINEIDRQAQSIGLNTGGLFAKSLSVFIGGGKAGGGISEIANGSTTINLSTSTVDAKSLGLKGTQAAGVSTVNLSDSSATSVEKIVTNATNSASESVGGFTDFYFKGPGFGGKDRVKVSVNLAGVASTDTLVAAVNAAIDNAGNGATAQATAFKNSGVRATIVTDASGNKSLGFTSGTTAFQVSAGDKTANALLGNVTSASDPTGLTLKNSVQGGAATAATGTTFAQNGTITVRLQGAGLAGPVDISLAVTTATTVDQALTALNTAVSQNAQLQAAGISAETAAAGSNLKFSSNHGERFEVQASGDVGNVLGLGSFASSTGATGNFGYTAATGAGAALTATTNETLEFSVGGGAKISITAQAATNTAQSAADGINAQIATQASLVKAGIVADVQGGQVRLRSLTDSNFRVNTVGNANIFGFGTTTATGAVFAANTNPDNNTTEQSFTAGGSQQTGLVAFTAIRNGSDAQTITFSANDSSGATKTVSVILKNDSTSQSGASVDAAIEAINAAIQKTNDPTLQKLVAVKDKAGAGGADGINFLSAGTTFKVQVGTNGGGTGLGSQGTVVNSATAGTGSTSDISSQDNAQAAVSALADAVQSLGNAQAAVGKGQNQFSFAVNLASSKLTNIAAAESRIRDADLASEAANLSKSQILLQAGISALAQANSAPQQVLALLRG